MSCFFCDSCFHVSYNCDKYISDESRKNIAVLKNCCPYCFTSTEHTPCLKCKNDQKCYICFSKTHATVYCPDRLTALYMFLPQIDEDLLSRFGKLLKKEERYLMAISYPTVFASMKLKPFKVKYQKELCIYKIDKLMDMNFISAEKVSVHNEYDRWLTTEQYAYNGYRRGERFATCTGTAPASSYPVFKTIPVEKKALSPPLKYPICYIKHIEIFESPYFSSELLTLLSSKAKVLKCVNINFYTKISLREILKKSPNLEDIDISGSEIEVNNSWPDDFLQLNHADCINVIRLSLADLNCNVESLATLMQKKSVKINLYLSISSSWNIEEVFKAARKKLSQHFVPSTTNNECQQCIKLLLTNGNRRLGDYENFVLKKL